MSPSWDVLCIPVCTGFARGRREVMSAVHQKMKLFSQKLLSCIKKITWSFHLGKYPRHFSKSEPTISELPRPRYRSAKHVLSFTQDMFNVLPACNDSLRDVDWKPPGWVRCTFLKSHHLWKSYIICSFNYDHEWHSQVHAFKSESKPRKPKAIMNCQCGAFPLSPSNLMTNEQDTIPGIAGSFYFT